MDSSEGEPNNMTLTLTLKLYLVNHLSNGIIHFHYFHLNLILFVVNIEFVRFNAISLS